MNNNKICPWAIWWVLACTTEVLAGESAQAQVDSSARQAQINVAATSSAQPAHAISLMEQAIRYQASNRPEAIAATRRAIDQAPSWAEPRALLISLLIAAQDDRSARTAIASALSAGAADSRVLIFKAWLDAKDGSWEKARQSLDEMLSTVERNVADASLTADSARKIAVDAALSAGDWVQAKTWLDLASPEIWATMASRSEALRMARRRTIYPQSAYYHVWALAPMSCTTVASVPHCPLLPADQTADAGFAAAETAYKQFAARDFKAAATQAALARQNAPANLHYLLLLLQSLLADGRGGEAREVATQALSQFPSDPEVLAFRSLELSREGKTEEAAPDARQALASPRISYSSEADLLIASGRRADARHKFEEAFASGGMDAEANLDIAYLAVRVGSDEVATTAFGKADQTTPLQGNALLDAAYAAGRAGQLQQSSGYFRRALDSAGSGQLSLTSQQNFDIRRTLADQARRWGINSSITYRTLPFAGVGSAPSTTKGTVQAAAEGYVRLDNGADGHRIEAFGGLLSTVYTENNPVGADPYAQGFVGLRAQPLANINLVLGVERRIAIGSLALNDWLLRAGYSWGLGQDMRVSERQWPSASVYAEAGRFVYLNQNYLTAEAKIGRSYRLDDSSPRFIATPHLVLAADANNAYSDGHKSAIAAGLGVDFRYWFNEERYSAPRSYWNLSIQARARVSGDDRARGLFVRAALIY